MAELNDETKRILDKLKKLFALAGSDNQHEAEAALGMANKIMQQHDLDYNEIDLHAEGNIVEEDVDLFERGGAEKWIGILAAQCSMLYDCKTTRSRTRQGYKLQFVGTPLDAAAAGMTFRHLFGSWKSIVNRDIEARRSRGGLHLDVRSYKRSHGMGFTVAIRQRILVLRAERNSATVSATGRDLVLVKGAAVDEFLKDVPTMKESKAKHDSTAAREGSERGKVIPLHGAIETGGDQDQQLMIGAR